MNEKESARVLFGQLSLESRRALHDALQELHRTCPSTDSVHLARILGYVAELIPPD